MRKAKLTELTQKKMKVSSQCHIFIVIDKLYRKVCKFPPTRGRLVLSAFDTFLIVKFYGYQLIFLIVESDEYFDEEEEDNGETLADVSKKNSNI